MKKPVVHLYTLCWDEAYMLGFFFRHYDSWVDRYVIYDDGSTDGSLKILQAHPRVELRKFSRTDPTSFVSSHTKIQNEVWKESRCRADWVVVTALDEHLWVPKKPMASYLFEQQVQNVTLIPALGFDMICQTMPQNNGLLVEKIRRGQPSLIYCKLSIFNPDALLDTNFAAGRHFASPTGRLKLPRRDELLLWHYKKLGFEETAAREKAEGARLGSTDIANGWGHQYLWSKEKFTDNWNAFDQRSSDLDERTVFPDANQLWWNSGVRRLKNWNPRVRLRAFFSRR